MHYRRGRGRVLSYVGALCLSVSCGEAPQAAQAPSGGASESRVVARVGEREITLEEVDARALKANMAVFQQLHDARLQAVEELLAEALLEEEAKKRGITAEELEAQEIRSKVREVTTQDVESFFNQNRARIPPGQTIEQLSGQIREYLAARNELSAREGYLSELRAKANVDVSLEPPRVPVTVAEGERVKGPAGAPVVIVEYSDFQ
jgi:hypothetical protein